MLWGQMRSQTAAAPDQELLHPLEWDLMRPPVQHVTYRVIAIAIAERSQKHSPAWRMLQLGDVSRTGTIDCTWK